MKNAAEHTGQPDGQRTKRGARSRRSRGGGGVAHADRRWCIPPAILSEPEESFEGVLLFEEHPDTVAFHLWLALRAVTLWAEVPPGQRAGLFNEGTAERRLKLLAADALEPELEVPLATFATILTEPEGIDASVATLMCLHVARWAEARAAHATAVAFAQAAALASPEDPVPALEVGERALAWARLPRAESWFRRAVGLARRAGDWETFVRAHVGLGTVLSRRGAHELARRQFQKALRATKRYGVRSGRAQALAGLARLDAEAGELSGGEPGL